MLFEGQPNFSLVSNGAECVMIEKKFFMEHATYKHLVNLREAVSFRYNTCTTVTVEIRYKSIQRN